jgi:multidrug efflux system membrane fusion protein
MDCIAMKLNSKTKSILMAVAIALAVSLWMLSGLGGDPSATNSPSSVRAGSGGSSDNPERPTRVVVQHSVARTITRAVSGAGRTEPNRRVELRAETDGSVVAIGAERGARVSAGQPIVELDMRDRESQLAEADALIEQMRLQYEGAERLRGESFVSDAQIAEARARLVSAEAAKERILDDIAYTTVDAPFDAVLQDRTVEIGDYVQAGDTVAELVDIDPMIVVGDVNEREVYNLGIGSPGLARLANGTLVQGTVRYLAPVADETTRTFRIELAVPNADGNLRAGVTAELRLDADEITAHSLSPALLALADDGAVGVKAVDDDNRVRFYPVEIVDSSAEGMSVTGLPRALRIISVGQGFVSEGNLVEPVMDPAAQSGSDDERPY